MKKMWTAVMVLGLIAAVVAIGQEVTSVNAVGFNKVTVAPGKFSLVTLGFESFGDSSVSDLMGDQFLDGTIYIWDRAGKEYIGLVAGARSGWSDATNVIHRGDAFWLLGGATTSSVSFMGEVPYTYNEGATTTVASLTGIDAIGYAYPTDIAWTNTTLSQDSNVETLYVWDEVAQEYDGFVPAARSGLWETDVVIPAGRAFWIVTKDGTSVDWTEIAPYDL